MSLEITVLNLMNNLAHNIRAQPLNLGGITGATGGLGGPPGGFVGVLPQTKIAYDTDEFALATTSGTPSLLDNLNHIRKRILYLEASGIGSSGVDIQEDEVTIVSNATILDFSGLDVSVIDNGAKITLVPANIKLDDLGTPDDNTDLDSSISRHGLLPKLPNDSDKYLNGVGSWSTISSGVGDHKVSVDDLDISPDYLYNKISAGSGITIANLGDTVEISTISPTLYIDQAGGTSDTFGVLSGVRNGVNKVFTVSQVSYTSGSLITYLNGQLLTQGTGEDWVELIPASGTFEFTNAPESTDQITAIYGKLAVMGNTNKRTYSEIVLCRHANDPIPGSTSTTYDWPGIALTANTSGFHADKLTGASIIYARWRGAWVPNAPGATVCGIRLVKCDDGPTNIEVLKTNEVGEETDPITWSIEITTELQAMLSAGTYKHIGHQTRGDGSNAPSIYASWIEIIWE